MCLGLGFLFKPIQDAVFQQPLWIWLSAGSQGAIGAPELVDAGYLGPLFVAVGEHFACDCDRLLG